jgi:hypothetical protein
MAEQPIPVPFSTLFKKKFQLFYTVFNCYPVSSAVMAAYDCPTMGFLE